METGVWGVDPREYVDMFMGQSIRATLESEGAIIVGRDDVNGLRCLIVRTRETPEPGDPSRLWRKTFWVAPDRQFAVVRRANEVLLPGRTEWFTNYHVELDDLRRVGPVWLPYRATYVLSVALFSPENPNGETAYHSNVTISDYLVNLSAPSSWIDVRCPSGIVVSGDRADAMAEITSDALSAQVDEAQLVFRMFDDIAARRIRHQVLWATAIAIAIIAAAILHHRYRRRRMP
jgi:hypothetical protein